MLATTQTERLLTELDHVRLSKLRDHELPPALEKLLDSAETVESNTVPADVVTMYSMVEVEDPSTNLRRKLTVCYPRDADASAGFVSVLSPVGSSLLGLRAGATARWSTPGGQPGEAKIVSILFQPEASGDYTA